ncbi:hypothetical protein P280DRAFT_485212 [Massarina eburnea CBS 473.64]|uniref:Siderophore biosynthesis enzyme n=1 Tax=Massarina eburnea CBS 473.64 TaxID=1395130 RepID=A0A6A6RLB1_9PLEO|nr:hypothetical protein P280DRAFT_485212 [Massarina eburnea CBS 473.64]
MKSFAILALAATAFAKTNLAGCTSSAVGASLLWYVPGTGEICSILDCGGGRAPPKTTVPGCAAYSGTASYTPSFIPGYGQASATGASATSASSAYAAVSSVPTAPATSASTILTPSASSASLAEPSTLTTSAAVLPSSGAPAVGTGGAVAGNATVTGGNNVTNSATPSQTGLPVSNGADLKGVAQGVMAVAVGVLGVMML